jgi:aminomethyltransferase
MHTDPYLSLLTCYYYEPIQQTLSYIKGFVKILKEEWNNLSTIQRTALYPEYEKHGAKTIDFGGWDLPVQFSSILKEHETTRTKASIFDVSHMGEIRIKGSGSLSFLQKMMTNDVSRLTVNRAQYTFMCNEGGGTIDDLLIYKLAEDDYLLVVNAANTDKDMAWLKGHHDKEEIMITNQSSDFALLAIQGPLAIHILQQTTKENIEDLKPFRCLQGVSIGDVETDIISRTGYTGEDGFEIYLTPDNSRDVWRLLLQAGKESGLEPAGLGARDSLRFEAGLPLYGQELSEDISPIEAGLTFAVKVNKQEDFIGKQALKKQVEEGPTRKLIGIEMKGKGIPRTGYDVLNDTGEVIGHVTTGTQAPTLNKAIGFALINEKYTKIGTSLKVQIRKRQVDAEVIRTPFYHRTNNREENDA